ncbi:hypothetical protein GCM10007382_23680 [Salinibacterium xinjiangense]|uniref:SipW-cognate class signal peptide n=1 Tax=Salinibacterium xinjiangense TaxID=386302 RepID=A0A2C9A0N0_9MICO|nr:hypothetical protein [Salinibacterium xinjiangense]GGL03116.1 hypothetical protein GCM10007382_23680 [Salinibacterium xinjiangense]SOE72272.1 hypothetical protein SAMN06296378_2437 [Salinibacterium xinjiangense]
MSALRRNKRTLITVAATAALVLAGGTAASAYWTAQGFGTGIVKTGSSTPFTIKNVAPTGLTPGGAAKTFAFTVTNPGTGTQKLSEVTVAVKSAGGLDWTAVTGCSAADFAVGNVVYQPGQIAGGGQLIGTIDISMLNRDANQDACQDIEIPLYFLAK